MVSFERYGDLELAHHDMRFQRRSWAIERAALAVLVGIVVLAAAGVFAGGPLSDAVVRDPRGGLAVSYERFMRLGHPDALIVEVGARPRGEPVRVSLPATYFERFELLSITPEPAGQTATRGAVDFTFEPGTRRVTLRVDPASTGLHRGHVRSGGAVEFRQMVWP